MRKAAREEEGFEGNAARRLALYRATAREISENDWKCAMSDFEIKVANQETFLVDRVLGLVESRLKKKKGQLQPPVTATAGSAPAAASGNKRAQALLVNLLVRFGWS